MTASFTESGNNKIRNRTYIISKYHKFMDDMLDDDVVKMLDEDI